MRPELAVDEDGRTLVVTPTGYLDLHEALDLRSALTEACRHDLPVVVDLSRVTALDAVALGVLVSAQRSLRSQGCDLTLAHPRARVLRALHLTGLDRLLAVRADER